jgi:hypothetical protein
MHERDVQIAGPCHEDWDRMTPEAGGLRRYCEHCDKRVHDLSAMDEGQARAFLAATAGREVCIAYTLGEDDELVFARRPPKARERRAADIVPLDRLRRSSPPPGRSSPELPELGKLAGAASVAALLSACTPHGQDDAPKVDLPEPAAVDPGARVDIPKLAPPRPPAAKLEVDAPAKVEEPCEPETPRRVRKGKRVIKKGLRLGGGVDPLGGL